MTATIIDLATWSRAAQFRLFRGYDRPHYAVTSRIDLTRLMTARKPEGVSPYRACLYAIGAGLHAVDELRMRFAGDVVTLHDGVALSMTVPRADGTFTYAYVPWQPDFTAFDADARQLIETAARAEGLNANTDQHGAVAYLSCLPWLDYTSLNNALPGPDDCIPRVSWGRIIQADGRHSCAMTIEVHHALVDGRQVGAFFAEVQEAADRL